MSWTYQQSTGKLTDPAGEWFSTCYSGHGEGLNNPAMEAVEGVGPIPAGTYKIGPARDPIDHLGPIALPLTVVRFANPALDRSGFFIHGDNAAADHSASDGCIVDGLAGRQLIDASSDDDLEVIP